jgi:uncharacterized membrane protein YfcA
VLTIALPWAGTEVWLPGVVLIGLLIGVLSGLFGVGGGFLLTPVLKILLGIPYPVAVGSSLIQITLNSALSAWKHGRNGNVDFKLGGLLAAGALAGADAGVRLHALLKGRADLRLLGRAVAPLDLVMNLLFLLLLAGVGVFVLQETARPSESQDVVQTALARRLRGLRLRPLGTFPRSGLTSYSLWTPLGLALIVGVLTGLMGVGGGFISFPLLLYVIGVPTHVAIGTSAFQILLASAYGALRHGLAGNLDPLLVGLLVPGSFAGVFVGARVSQLLGGRSIRRYFALVVFVGAAMMVWELVRELLL